MIKFNPDLERMKQLEDLQKKKEEKEEELEELEEQKKEELEELEMRLQEAVAELAEPDEEELQEGQEEEEVREETPEPEESLEERIAADREREIREGGPIYEVESSDLENLPELYNQVRQEVQQGNPQSDVIDRAREMIYHLEHKDDDAYVSQDALEMAERDRSEQGAQYVDRLSALLDRIEGRSDKGTYKNDQPGHV